MQLEFHFTDLLNGSVGYILPSTTKALLHILLFEMNPPLSTYNIESYD